MSIIPRFIVPFRSPLSRAFEEMWHDMAHMEKAFFPPMSQMGRFSQPIEGPALSESVNDSNKFQLSLDVNQFKPEELKISLEGRTLVVEGNQETKDNNGFFKRSFSRRWLLPEDVHVADLTSTLTENGRLSIEAPKKAQETTNIPIQNIQQKAVEGGNTEKKE